MRRIAVIHDPKILEVCQDICRCDMKMRTQQSFVIGIIRKVIPLKVMIIDTVRYIVSCKMADKPLPRDERESASPGTRERESASQPMPQGSLEFVDTSTCQCGICPKNHYAARTEDATTHM